MWPDCTWLEHEHEERNGAVSAPAARLPAPSAHAHLLHTAACCIKLRPHFPMYRNGWAVRARSFCRIVVLLLAGYDDLHLIAI
jgi:hypothetical protein